MVQQSLTGQEPAQRHAAVYLKIYPRVVLLAPEWNSGEKARMEAVNTWIIGWIVVHIAALVTAYGTRVAAGSRLESVLQILFYAALLIIGAALWVCQQTQAGAWGLSAITLIAMVLTAVVDFRKFGEPRSIGQTY
jgi:hypothetical protein